MEILQILRGNVWEFHTGIPGTLLTGAGWAPPARGHLESDVSTGIGSRISTGISSGISSGTGIGIRAGISSRILVLLFLLLLAVLKVKGLAQVLHPRRAGGLQGRSCTGNGHGKHGTGHGRVGNRDCGWGKRERDGGDGGEGRWKRKKGMEKGDGDEAERRGMEETEEKGVELE